MSFFDSNYLPNFLNYPEISSFLQFNKITLLTKKQVDDYVKQAPMSISRPTRKTKKQSQTNRLENFQIKQQKLFRENVISRVCVGTHSEHFYSQLETEPETNEALFVFSNGYQLFNPNVVTDKDYIKHKLEQVKGIIIIKKGECPSNPMLYTITQCCSIIDDYIPLLLGATLFILKSNPQYVFKRILAYDNDIYKQVYSHFGFGYNTFLICSNKMKNLVETELQDLKIEDIIQKTINIPENPPFDSINNSNKITSKTNTKKSVKDLISEYERRIKSYKRGGKKRVPNKKTRKKNTKYKIKK